jgi:carbamoyltransferase
LINTSFNQHDEPIIENPEEAIKMFLSTDLDYLVI